MSYRFALGPVFLLVVCLTACGGTSEGLVPVDGSVPGDASTTPDAGGGPRFALYAPCTAASQCGTSTQAICRLDFPGGLCSRSCSKDVDCGSFGRCTSTTGGTLCLPRCSLGAGECSTYGGMCVAVDSPTDPTAGACLPSCYPAGTTMPADEPSCVQGTTCDPYALSCVVTPAQVGGLADDGAPCTADTECKSGVCIVDGEGWIGGYCVSYGRVVVEPFVADAPHARSNCPAGSAIVDLAGTAGPGDVATCLATCTRSSTADLQGTCRAGYRCVYSTSADGTQSSSDGVCRPIDCNAAAYVGQANQGCPGGYSCDAASGICVPPI